MRSETFRCPHCRADLKKSAAAFVLGEAKSSVVMGGMDPTVTCPACGGSIDTQSMIEGKYDVGKGCFIATAVYGDVDSPEVRRFRLFSDRVLQASLLGRSFVRLYNWLGPATASRLARRPLALRLVRWVLDAVSRTFRGTQFEADS